MLKKMGLSVMLLAGLLAFAAPRKADAAVRFGVYLGAPAYSYPAYPAPAYPDYYDYPAPAYAYPAPYAYQAPAYVAPYGYGYGYGHGREFRGYERPAFRGYERHERHERNEGFRGGHRR